MIQFSCISLYKLTHEWYKEKQEKKKILFSNFSHYITNYQGCQIYIYSTSYFRSDTDFLVWNFGENFDRVKDFDINFRKLSIYPYLKLTYRYFSITKESRYIKEHEHKEQTEEDRTTIKVAGKRFLFVYPFTKKREWYKISESVRLSMMKEHFLIGHKYPDIKIHTTYCYGLHDYEFILIFESDKIERFLELVEELRFSDASQYTLIDTPIFVGENTTLAELEAQLL